MVLEKKTFEKTQIQKDTFPCLYVWEWTKQILPNDDFQK